MPALNVNLQDSFLNKVRREGIVVQVMLANGVLLEGYVKGFDNFTLILSTEGMQHLLYKHAIAQIIAPKFMRSSSNAGEPDGDEPVHSDAPAPGEKKRDGKPREDKNREAKPEKFNRIDFSNIRRDTADGQAE
jgi:host factor-I protein